MILVRLRELHVSPDGEKWEITEDDKKRLFIRYTPSPASGGRQRILTMEAFLSPEHHGRSRTLLRSSSRTASCLFGREKRSSISPDAYSLVAT